MAKATKPTPAKRATPPRPAPKDGEYLCVVDRVTFDDGSFLLRDQTITLSEEDAANYLKAETLARV